jgi:hypothetical protein
LCLIPLQITTDDPCSRAHMADFTLDSMPPVPTSDLVPNVILCWGRLNKSVTAVHNSRTKPFQVGYGQYCIILSFLFYRSFHCTGFSSHFHLFPKNYDHNFHKVMELGFLGLLSTTM